MKTMGILEKLAVASFFTAFLAAFAPVDAHNS
jgi:hypothetical protein